MEQHEGLMDNVFCVWAGECLVYFLSRTSPVSFLRPFAPAVGSALLYTPALGLASTHTAGVSLICS